MRVASGDGSGNRCPFCSPRRGPDCCGDNHIRHGGVAHTVRGYDGGVTGRHFPFLFEPRYRGPARVFGVTPHSCGIDVDDELIDAWFGPWRVRTPRSNVAGARITGPYTVLKTAGPARLGITDRSLTFATNSWRGVEISFRTAIPGIDPLGLIRHPTLTLTAADCDRLADALGA